MKTLKSFRSRLKITRRGKILARKPGQDHFNAKESGRSQIGKSRTQPFVMTQRSKRRFLA